MSNLDKAKPAVAIELGGRVRRVVFDLWAISIIEEERGEKFLLELKNLTIPKLLFLLWASLVSDSPELDGATSEDRRIAQKKVVDWVNASGLQIKQISKVVLEAFKNSSPLSSEGAESKNEAGVSEI
jgi:hypothetical protein